MPNSYINRQYIYIALVFSFKTKYAFRSILKALVYNLLKS